MSDLQMYFRNNTVTPALTEGNAPDYSEHLYLIDQFDEGEIILWGDVLIDARDPQRLEQNHGQSESIAGRPAPTVRALF